MYDNFKKPGLRVNDELSDWHFDEDSTVLLSEEYVKSPMTCSACRMLACHHGFFDSCLLHDSAKPNILIGSVHSQQWPEH